MAPTRPNSLFVLTDQQRPDWVGTNPDVPVRTPALDALGERGVHFSNAVCPAPLCGPSRACLASGLRYPDCGMWTNETYPADRETYYGRLRDEAGYETIGVGDIDLVRVPVWGLDGTRALDSMGFSDGVEVPGKNKMRKSYQWDFDEFDFTDVADDVDVPPPGVDPSPGNVANAYMADLQERGLLDAYLEDMIERMKGDQYQGNYTITRPAPVPHDAYVDNWVGRRGLEFLRSAPEDRPWHLVVNFVGPHDPMDVSAEMHGWYRDPDVAFPSPVDPDENVDSETHQEIRRNYAAICENVDRWLGRYVDVLAARGELADTVVVFASDHGDLLGDHGGWGKLSPRRASVGVPLAVAGPGVESRGRVDEPVSLLDLHATFLEYGGLDPGDLDSRSLRPYLEGETGHHRDVVRSSLGPWEVVSDGRYDLLLGWDAGDDYDAGWEQLFGFLDEFASESDRRTARERRQRQCDPLVFDRESPGNRAYTAGERPDVVDRLSRRAGVDR